jgi:hypothetical protein
LHNNNNNNGKNINNTPGNFNNSVNADKLLFSNLELVHANSAAKKRFNLANSDELCDLAERIELK